MSQYVYFSVRSATLRADEMTRALGLAPDRERAAGETRREPEPVPPENSWAIYATERGVRLDRQISQLLARLRPVSEALQELTRRDDVTTALVIVRNFNDLEGEGDVVDPLAAREHDILSWLTGSHPLLGWEISNDDLRFLASLGTEVIAEEHG